METCDVVLTFEPIDEILWCDHSDETSSAALLHGTIGFSIFHKMKFGIFLNFDFWHSWELINISESVDEIVKYVPMVIMFFSILQMNFWIFYQRLE